MMKKLLALLALVLLTSAAYSAPRYIEIDSGVQPIFGTVTDAGADTLRLKFSSLKQFTSLSFNLKIGAIASGGVDSALVLSNYFGEVKGNGKTPAGKKLSYSIESLTALSAPDTVFWISTSGTSVKYLDYANTGWTHFVIDLEEYVIPQSSILELIIRDGNLDATGDNTFDWVLEIDAKK